MNKVLGYVTQFKKESLFSNLKSEEVDLPEVVGVEGDEFRLNLFQQRFDLGLATLLLRLVRVGLQRVEVRLAGA
jgi:hypothetical protein